MLLECSSKFWVLASCRVPIYIEFLVFRSISYVEYSRSICDFKYVLSDKPVIDLRLRNASRRIWISSGTSDSHSRIISKVDMLRGIGGSQPCHVSHYVNLESSSRGLRFGYLSVVGFHSAILLFSSILLRASSRMLNLASFPLCRVYGVNVLFLKNKTLFNSILCFDINVI